MKSLKFWQESRNKNTEVWSHVHDPGLVKRNYALRNQAKDVFLKMVENSNKKKQKKLGSMDTGQTLNVYKMLKGDSGVF